ncbi:MAG: class I SAM-dependent methyltransferase [Pyrinomonadaceae bacterium]
MTYALFGKAADRYDWHTPPHHYQDDHAFVLSKFPNKGCRILDVGCGTGVFLERAVNAGIDAIGIDASPEMISVAAKRVDSDRVRIARMQELKEAEIYDGIVSLSWSFNYVDSFAEATDVLTRFFNALKPGGRLILQIAHAPNATGALNEDREPGPDGQSDDVLFLYRFSQVRDCPGEMRAQYVYGCKSRSELLSEEHILNAADANEVAARLIDVGFNGVELLDSWRGEPLASSVSAFLLASRP